MANPLQQKFHELTAKKVDLEAGIEPIAAEYDAVRQEINALDAKLKPIAERLKAARAPLYELDNERASLARALNGQTGKPD